MSDLQTVAAQYLWPPYTALNEVERARSFVVERAQGSFFFTPDGRRIFDGSGSWWCSNLGHAHPRIVSAIKEQTASMLHVPLAGIVHENAARLSQELVELAPAGLTKVFYSDSGSTAVEVALKLAVQYFDLQGRSEKSKFLSLPGAYHGDSVGAMSVSDVSVFSSPFRSLMFNAETSDARPETEGWQAVFSELCAKVEENAHELAAVIVEPIVQGAGGMRFYPPRLLKELSAVCKSADVLLIADEIFSGFLRSGTFWACEQAGISPDLLVTGKGLSAGAMPFSATLIGDQLYRVFEGGKDRAFMHGQTFCGNALGARIGREVLSIYRDTNMHERVACLTSQLNELWEPFSELPGVKNARTHGAVAAFEVGNADYLGNAGWKIHDLALERGLHARPLGNTVYLVPALTTEADDLAQAVHILYTATEEIVAR